jgi:hypothetical protein
VLLKPQPLLRRQATLAPFRIIPVHLAQHLRHMAALLGKVLHDFHKLAPSMRQTVRHQNLHAAGQLRHVPRQRITHLDHRAQVLRPLFQHIGDVLAGVLAPGEVQGDLLALPGRNNAAGEHAGAFVTGFALQL